MLFLLIRKSTYRRRFGVAGKMGLPEVRHHQVLTPVNQWATNGSTVEHTWGVGQEAPLILLRPTPACPLKEASEYMETRWSGFCSPLFLHQKTHTARLPLAFAEQGVPFTKCPQRDDIIPFHDFSCVAGNTVELLATNLCNHLKGVYIP